MVYKPPIPTLASAREQMSAAAYLITQAAIAPAFNEAARDAVGTIIDEIESRIAGVEDDRKTSAPSLRRAYNLQGQAEALMALGAWLRAAEYAP